RTGVADAVSRWRDDLRAGEDSESAAKLRLGICRISGRVPVRRRRRDESRSVAACDRSVLQSHDQIARQWKRRVRAMLLARYSPQFAAVRTRSRSNEAMCRNVIVGVCALMCLTAARAAAA